MRGWRDEEGGRVGVVDGGDSTERNGGGGLDLALGGKEDDGGGRGRGGRGFGEERSEHLSEPFGVGKRGVDGGFGVLEGSRERDQVRNENESRGSGTATRQKKNSTHSSRSLDLTSHPVELRCNVGRSATTSDELPDCHGSTLVVGAQLNDVVLQNKGVE